MLVGETANRQLKRDGYFDDDDLRLLDHPVETKTNLRTLPEAAGDLLLTNSISPIPLHKTLVLLEAWRNTMMNVLQIMNASLWLLHL